jgi:hypothetical protein
MVSAGVAAARARARLAWWLGPWAPRDRGPADVVRAWLALGGGSYLYRPARAAVRTAWLVSPGLHPAGPDDPRIDRFARVLASAGALVLSPRSPTFCGLRLAAGAIAELAAARAALAALAEARGLPLRVVSPSVGSLAALHLAADPAATVERTVLIGGYVDAAALARSMTGGDAVARDPSNAPVAMATFVEHLPVAIADRAALVAAWDAVVREVWAVPAWMRAGSTAHHAVAHRHAARVAAADRELFLVGCGVRPGAAALVAAAQATGAYAHLELRPLLPAIAGELHAFHGPADAVVPVEQLDALLAAAPRARGHRLRGLDHGGPRPLATLLAQLRPRALAAELGAFAALVDVLAA